MNTEDNKSDVVDVSKENIEDFYEWNLIPITYPPEKKTGITFKGDTDEYIEAHQRIWNMMNKKGINYRVNGRDLRFFDNSNTKTIKFEVKPLKGSSGKVNLKMYNVNGNGIATMMIQKVSNSEMVHVKVVAFKIIKYLLDGMIDGEISDDDIANMKQESNGKLETDLDLLLNAFCVAKDLKKAEIWKNM